MQELGKKSIDFLIFLRSCNPLGKALPVGLMSVSPEAAGRNRSRYLTMSFEQTHQGSWVVGPGPDFSFPADRQGDTRAGLPSIFAVVVPKTLLCS